MKGTAISPYVVCALFAWLAPMLAANAASPPALHFAELVDTQAPPTSAAIISGSLNDAFKPLAGGRLSSTPEGDRWYAVVLSHDWPGTELPVLSFRNPEGGSGHPTVRAYVPPIYDAQVLRNDADLGLSPDVMSGLLPATIRADQPIYLLIAGSRAPIQTEITLTSLPEYLSHTTNQARLIAGFEGVQVAMLLIGLFLWLLLRDRLYLYFFGYIAAQLIFGMLLSGDMYLLPHSQMFAALGGVPFAVLTAVLAISFIIEFCNLRRSVPRTAAVFSAIRWPLLATIPFTLMPSSRFDGLLISITNWLILLACVTAIATVLMALLKGNRQARFFFLAWIPELTFTIYRILQLQAGWDQPTWIHYGLPFSMAFATLVITVGLADQIMHARRERDNADVLANEDPLTGAFNRRAIITQLDAAVAAAHRNSQPLALLFIDVDHFKVVNDTYGHAVGDRCLQRIVDVIGTELRADDWMGRYGGEEFVAVLPDANRENAQKIGERVRASIEAQPLQIKGASVLITVSVGVAGIVDKRDSTDALLERADAALYRAKAAGRNRLVTQPSWAAVGVA